MWIQTTLEDPGPTDAKLVQQTIEQYDTGKIQRKTFYQRMARLGYQKTEALKLTRQCSTKS